MLRSGSGQAQGVNQADYVIITEQVRLIRGSILLSEQKRREGEHSNGRRTPGIGGQNLVYIANKMFSGQKQYINAVDLPLPSSKVGLAM
jgi:hypothetical protein